MKPNRTEKRREQSRRSALNRRKVESQYYDQIKAMLPMQVGGEPEVVKIDRIAVLRIALCYYRIRKFAGQRNYLITNIESVETVVIVLNIRVSL